MLRRTKKIPELLLGISAGVLLSLAVTEVPHVIAQRETALIQKARLLQVEKIRSMREALAQQVEIQRVEVSPISGGPDNPYKTYHVYWFNRGPKPIAKLYAKVDVIDIKTGERTPDSTHKTCVFSSVNDGGRILPGQATIGTKDNNHGVLLRAYYNQRSPIRVQVTPVLADEFSDPLEPTSPQR